MDIELGKFGPPPHTPGGKGSESSDFFGRSEQDLLRKMYLEFARTWFAFGYVASLGKHFIGLQKMDGVGASIELGFSPFRHDRAAWFY